MSKSFTGNVFATTSREAIEKFLNISQYRVPFSDFLTKLTDEQLKRSIICSPGRNNNLIDFEMNYGFGREGYTYILRFLETGSLFEAQFLNKDVYAETTGKMLLDANVPNQKNKIDLDSQIIETYTENSSRDIFIAFGVGDKIDSWAGPFVGTLVKSNFTMAEGGIREITLEFSNQEGKLRRNEIEGSRSKNIYSIMDKYSNIYKNKKINLDFKTVVPYDSIFKESIHTEIVGLIENYIKAISNSADKDVKDYNYNVIVLLPSIKNLFEKTVNKSAVQKGEVEQESINKIGLVGSKKFTSSDNYGKFVTEYQKLQSELERQKVVNQQAYSDASGYNLDFYRSEKKINPLNAPREVSKLFQEEDKTQILQRNIDVIQKKYEEEIKLCALQIQLKLNPDSKSTTTESTPDYYVPLANFNNSFRERYGSIPDGTYNYNPVFLIESDLRILNLWHREGFILDPKKQTFIFGDDGMIEDLLYAMNYLKGESVNNIITNRQYISKKDVDKFITGKQNYRRDIYNLLKVNRKNSSFGDVGNTKDELALDDFTRGLVKFTDYQDIPIFRHNIANPNVLSLSITNDTSYLDVYRIGYAQKSLIPFITDPSRLNLESLLGGNSQKGGGYIDENGDFIETSQIEANLGRYISGTPEQIGGGTTNAIGKKKQLNIIDLVQKAVDLDPAISSDINALYTYIKGLATDNATEIYARQMLAQPTLQVKDNEGNIKIVPFGTEKKAAFIAFYIFKMYNKPITPTLEFLNQQELAAFEKDTFERLARTAQTINLKTLPWFSITGFVAGQQCILIALQNVIGSKEKREAFYNGLYVINGYRHIISPQEMYSEFSISKHPASQVDTNAADFIQ